MTLVELLVSLSLGTMVLAAGLNLLSMSASSQIHATLQARVQGDAFLAWRAVEVELRQATAILSPGSTGARSDVLTGCDNYDAGLGVLNPAVPASGFMFCEKAGSVYLYRLSTCPPIMLPTCGSSGGTVVAGGVSHSPGAASYYSRSSPGLVRFAYQASAAGQSQPVDVAIMFNAAAGNNQ